jgi:integrase
MARVVDKLSPKGVEKAKNPGYYNDGGGLYLLIGPNEAKSWVFRYRADGRLREMGLGPLHTVGLAEARGKARQCRHLRLDGIDPIEVRKATRTQAKLDAAKVMTFAQCAERYIASHKAGWKNPKHAAQWPATLGSYVNPVFGSLPVQSIDVGLVMKAIEPIWMVKPETAGRVRGRIESILDWATTRGYRKGENPARWRGHLENLLPKKSKVRRVEHHAALPYVEISDFMAELRQQDGIAARSLELAILSAARTGEVISARWIEVDFDGHLWAIPAGRMKAGNEHRVPLSDAALAILRRSAEDPPGRVCFSREQDRPADQQHGDVDAVTADGPRRFNGARVPIKLPRLGGRAHYLRGRGCRDGAGARRVRQGRGGLQTRRSIREAPRVDGRMGAVLRCTQTELVGSRSL